MLHEYAENELRNILNATCIIYILTWDLLVFLNSQLRIASP